MNMGRGLKNFLLSREGQRGQILVMIPVAIVAVAALAGMVLDGALYAWLKYDADTNAARACIAAAEAHRRGGSAQVAFETLLQRNGYTADRYSPNVGSASSLTRGLDQVGSSWYSAVSWDEPTIAFLRLVGVDMMPILGQSRCVGRDSGGLSPIAVRETALEHSWNGEDPQEYSILGRDPKWDLADVESGENFRGAVFLHMWCIPASDPNCPDLRVFYPLTEDPPSAQTQKKLVEDCFRGINCAIWPESLPQRLPIVAGTSNAQLCKAFQEGWSVGDKVVVLVFNGEVYVPDPSYGNWENVAVIGFAVYEITAFEPNDNNCNNVIARLVSDQIYTDLDDIPGDVILLRSREIQWDYQGAIPWN
mgnify:CR=1 FL=1